MTAPKKQKTIDPKALKHFSGKPAGKPSAAIREPTDFQLLCCNLAGDLIANGGHRDDVEALATALTGHSRWLEFKQKRDFDRGQIDLWYSRLEAGWRKRPDPSYSLPETVSQQVRANVRDDLRDNLEYFFGSARMHELFLLHEVMVDFVSCNRGPTSDLAESVLAEAFMHQIGSDKTYVKVPRAHLSLVEQYIVLLEGKEESE